MGENQDPDFSGWATKNDIKCSDGVTIRGGAFKHMDKVKVPLVWMHQHKDPEMVLGHVILEHRDQGTYAEAFFNDTPKALAAKAQVAHGDITKMSIWANNLAQRGGDVLHGDIKEVSLVLAGANEGAEIEHIFIRHGAADLEETGEAIITTGLIFDFIAHADGDVDAEPAPADKAADAETVKDTYDTLNPIQKVMVNTMVSQAIEAGRALATGSTADVVAHSDVEEENKTNSDAEISASEEEENKDTEDKSEDEESKDESEETNDAAENIQHSNLKGAEVTNHNVFEQNNQSSNTGPEKKVLAHDAMRKIWDDAIVHGTLEKSIIAHAGDYGIDDIELLFAEARNMDASPQLLARQAEWVPKVLDAVKKQPWAKVKSIVADLTADEARAKGYIKGTEKQDEVIALLRRTTSPTTIYKKQRLDRDDILDITDFDVVVWIKWEMRFMLNEELARAILIGDGRTALHPDKIKDPAGQIDGIGIRSILNDSDLYVYKKDLTANIGTEAIVEEFIRSRSEYRGSGSPTLYTTDKILSDILLLKDKMGRFLYDTEAALAAKLRVKEIVAVEVMEQVPTVLGIVVNLVDYSIGTNKGGELTFFEDFNLDFNQEIKLLETRLSGGLTKPKSAVVLTRSQGTSATPAAPSFDGATNTITVPTTTGIDYTVDGDPVTGSVVITEDTELVAKPKAGYFIPAGSTSYWAFTYTP